MSDEQVFLEEYDSSEYPPFAVTCDLNIFTVRDGVLKILLIERGDNPFKGSWALPGGFVNINESAEDAAARELFEETGLHVGELDVHLEQLKTYSTPKRDPRMRVVSVGYVVLSANLPEPKAGDDASDARWWPVEDVLGDNPEITLAFDHKLIVEDALERVRAKLEYTTLAATFVDEPFSLSDLWRVYKAVWGEEPLLANFRRKVLSVNDFVNPAGEYTSGGVGPRAKLYTRGNTTEIQPAMLRESKQ